MPGRTYENLEAHREFVLPDQYFEPHSHDADQLAWIPGGARIRVGDSRWHLHGDHFAWIPGLVEHEMQMSGASEMFSLYLAPSLRLPEQRWSRPLVLPADAVAVAVVQSLCAHQVQEARLQASLALLTQILSSTNESYDALAVPADARARVVAEAILDDPQDSRDLEEWARHLDLSTKTLHRAFLADTGLSFSQWRTRARVYAAERLLVEGHAVQDTAELVGYRTPTGFIKAFRHVFGSTPATYIRAKRRLQGAPPLRRSGV
ncbi:MAG: AraC family transcriptional regulator [Candidatus Microbacterium colombiense]|nr:MAG: AraC family transcriptional regulator [Microbacterium sp.]